MIEASKLYDVGTATKYCKTPRDQHFAIPCDALMLSTRANSRQTCTRLPPDVLLPFNNGCTGSSRNYAVLSSLHQLMQADRINWCHSTPERGEGETRQTVIRRAFPRKSPTRMSNPPTPGPTKIVLGPMQLCLRKCWKKIPTMHLSASNLNAKPLGQSQPRNVKIMERLQAVDQPYWITLVTTHPAGHRLAVSSVNPRAQALSDPFCNQLRHSPALARLLQHSLDLRSGDTPRCLLDAKAPFGKDSNVLPKTRKCDGTAKAVVAWVG